MNERVDASPAPDSAQGAEPDENDYLRALTDSELCVVVRWKPDGTTTWVSPSVARILGVSQHEYLGRAVQASYPSGDESAAIATLLAALTPDSPTYSFETPVRLPGGVERWVRREHRGFFRDGELVSIQTIGIDVTETRRALEEARASEQRLISVLDHLEDSILLLGADGAITWACPRTVREFGDDPTGWVDGVLAAFSDEALTVIGAAFERVRDGGRMAQERVMVKATKNGGTLIDLELLQVNMLDVGGVNAIVLHAKDVTARERAATIEFETYLRELLTDVQEFVLQLDDDEVIRYASPCFEVRVRSSSIGMRLRDALLADADEESIGALERLLSDVRSTAGRRVMSRLRAGTTDPDDEARWIELTARYVAEPGTPPAIVIVGRLLDDDAAPNLAVVAGHSGRTADAAETDEEDADANDLHDLVERFRRLSPSEKLGVITALRSADSAPA